MHSYMHPSGAAKTLDGVHNSESEIERGEDAHTIGPSFPR